MKSTGRVILTNLITRLTKTRLIRNPASPTSLRKLAGIPPEHAIETTFSLNLNLPVMGSRFAEKVSFVDATLVVGVRRIVLATVPGCRDASGAGHLAV